MTFEERSLWDVEDADLSRPVRELQVRGCSSKDMAEFCRRYHYTGIGSQLIWRYGLWDELTILGVIGYNWPRRSVGAAVFGEEHADRVWHMGRLAVADRVPDNAESRLIGGSLRLIQRDHPNVWAVLTYAAIDAGHVGYVYQGTNAIYTGTAGETWFYVDPQGRRRSTYLSGRVLADRAKAMGWTRREGQAKHRYVYVLGDKRQRRDRLRRLQLPQFPYPKCGASLEGETSVPQTERRGSIPRHRSIRTIHKGQ